MRSRSENADNRLRLAAAREDFLDAPASEPNGVPDIIAASWRRSQSSGVDRSTLSNEYFDELDTESRLVRCAAPVIDRLGDEAADLSLSIALTDSRARILRRHDTNRYVGNLLDRINFAPGFGYDEGAVGTNGVGTVLESGASVAVLGSEHFHDRLQPFACVGAPVIDPLSGRVEGVLDISSLADHWSPLIHSLVRAAAADIGRNLLFDRKPGQQALFESFIRADARGHGAVIAIGESIVMSNTVARQLFSADDQLRIQDAALYLVAHHERGSSDLELESGRAVRIRSVVVHTGADRAGVVAAVDPIVVAGPQRTLAVDEERRMPEVAPMPRPSSIAALDSLRRASDSLPASGSRAWTRASEDLTEALRHRHPVLVMGETGSGKFTMISDHFHRLYPHGRSISFDASRVTVDSYPEAAAALQNSAQPTLYILRNIDQLTHEGAERLVEFMAHATAPMPSGESGPQGSVCATLSDEGTDSALPFRMLLPAFHHSVSVPALRFRTEDIKSLVDRMLGELAPGRDVRLSPDAMQLVVRFAWPGNLSQLHDALEWSLKRRPVGTILREDLPTYCHAQSGRRHSPLEQAERDAIVRALIEADGNRRRAAESLGMARSSLYRKLDYYRITSP